MSDLISKAEVLSLVERMMETYWDRKQILSIVRNAIEKLPSAEPKKGKWIGEGDGYADGYMVYDLWYCSNCDYCYEGDEEPDWNYCPNCGAKMEVKE